MPILNKLKPELIDALGKSGTLVTRYEALRASKDETLRDKPEAIQYIEDVIKRYKSIQATSPSNDKLRAKKESYLSLLKQHAAEMSICSFSKPEDLASRLERLDFEYDMINEMTKKLEQAGGDEDTCIAFLSSLLVINLSLASCGDSHHHGHPSRF